MTNVIERVVAWIREQQRPLIIGISGHGAAGKTTFTANLVGALQQDVNVLNTDPYIVPSTFRQLAQITYTYNGKTVTDNMTACHPSAHNIAFLERDVRMLREHMDVLTLPTHYAPSELLQGERTITIVEGMSVAFIDASLFDVRLYFYTDADTELARRMMRDVMERGTAPQYLQQSHERRRAQYELFMHPSSAHFDVLVKHTTFGETIERIALS